MEAQPERIAPSLEGLHQKANWRALPSSFAGISETGTRLQVNRLTPISRRPRSRRSPWLRQTRATLRAISKSRTPVGL
jgi:hypothetical protein